MKFIHCSDIHLGRKPAGAFGDYSAKRYNDYFAAFAHIIDTAIKRNSDFIIISGDLTDKKELHPEALERIEQILARPKDAGIMVYAIEGNHDNITPGRESESWLIYLENKGLLKRPYTKFEDGEYRFYPVLHRDLIIYGLGYPGLFADEVMARLSEHIENSDAAKNIIIVHTAIAGNELMPGTVSPATVELLKGKALYIAGGHFHSFSAAPNNEPVFFVPGSAEYWELSEHSQKKGMILFDTDTKAYEFIESKKRKIHYRSFEHNAENEIGFLDEFRAFAGTLEIAANEDIVKIDIKHNNQFYADTAYCESIIKEKGALKASVELKSTGSESALDLNTAVTGSGQIEREVISTWKEFSPYADITADSLDMMKKHTDDEHPELIHEVFDNLLAVILGDGETDED